MISLPLMKQSIKSNWALWLVMTIVLCVIIITMKIVIKTSLVTEINFNMEDILPYIIAIMNDGLDINDLLVMMGMDMNRVEVLANLDVTQMINDIFYTSAIGLVPMIYIIIAANKLVASQVDRGSMAYVLSTPTRRSTVMYTQALYMVGSLFLMFFITTAVDITSTAILGLNINLLLLFLLNLGLFITMLAISGICFMASSVFNLSKYSLALSGGACLTFYIAKLLGLFGDPTFVAVGMGVSAMKNFNYLSLLTLFDTASIANFINGAADYGFIWKFLILLGVAAVTYSAGMLTFVKKDLPL